MHQVVQNKDWCKNGTQPSKDHFMH